MADTSLRALTTAGLVGTDGSGPNHARGLVECIRVMKTEVASLVEPEILKSDSLTTWYEPGGQFTLLGIQLQHHPLKDV